MNPLDEELELDPDDDAEPGEQPHTDLGNARRLIADHGIDLRYNPQIDAWLAWDGHRWAEDVTGEARRRAKKVVDSMFTQIATAPASRRKRLFAHWMRSQSAARIEAMIALARTEPGVPVVVADLDADPWALNTRSGVVDLRTGDLTRHDRRSLVTKLAPIDIDPRATCPTWITFLKWAMCGDDDLVNFLQRAVGYSLTGLVVEQCMLFSHGCGENGKSTFHNVLGALLGDYAIAAAPDLLLTTAHEQHPTGTADLIGRRVVVVQEADQGRKLAEGTLKQLTGGDRIKARRMRQDFFEFDATHKIWMAANHKPQVRGTDHAIWRRIHLIPWDARVDPAVRDKHFVDKLYAELPGILNWAIAGCEAWQHAGLAPPDAVTRATADYRVEQDHVGRFLEDCCVLGPQHTVSARTLRVAYEEWCAENGERPWSARAMAPQLVERDCERIKDRHTKHSQWTGLAIAESIASNDKGSRDDPKEWDDDLF